MRTTICILVFVLVSLLTFAGETITGKSNSLLGNYTIAPMGENIFKLSYSNSDAVFTIEVCKEKEQCCYLLRSDAVEVMYLCNELGFGMRKMPDNRKKLETDVYKHLIDAETFSQQSLLTSNRKTQSEALALIACFFPHVIKTNSYGIVFNYTNEGKIEELSIK
jgi:hypothetical protein